MPPSQAHTQVRQTALHSSVEVLSLGAGEILRRVSKRAFGAEGDSGQQIHAEVSTHTEGDVLHQLRVNVRELEDLSLQLGFMMREVSYLIRKH